MQGIDEVEFHAIGSAYRGRETFDMVCIVYCCENTIQRARRGDNLSFCNILRVRDVVPIRVVRMLQCGPPYINLLPSGLQKRGVMLDRRGQRFQCSPRHQSAGKKGGDNAV